MQRHDARAVVLDSKFGIEGAVTFGAAGLRQLVRGSAEDGAWVDAHYGDGISRGRLMALEYAFYRISCFETMNCHNCVSTTLLPL